MNPAHALATTFADKITLPAVYDDIRALLSKPDATIDDFVDVIFLDSTLSLRIKKIANSDFFGHSRRAETVNQAVSNLGMFQIHDLLLSVLAIRAFSTIPADIFNQKAFWRSCIYCGILARMLAQRCMLPAKERLFAAGLLHEVGHIAMFAKIPEQIQDILVESQNNEMPLYQLERQKLGFDYGAVGSEIMQLWHLPQSYCDIAKYHMTPELAENNEIEAQIVNLARSVMLDEEQGINKSAKQYLHDNNLINDKMTEQDVDNMKIDARSNVDAVMDCLWPFATETSSIDRSNS